MNPVENFLDGGTQALTRILKMWFFQRLGSWTPVWEKTTGFVFLVVRERSKSHGVICGRFSVHDVQMQSLKTGFKLQQAISKQCSFHCCH